MKDERTPPPAEPLDAELLARLRKLTSLGAEEKALACSLLDAVLAMRQLRSSWQEERTKGT